MSISKAYYLFGILLLGLLWTSNATAQVQIAPVALYLDEDNKTGRIVVRNSSDQPVELSTTLHFGYPATNSDGKIHLRLFEEVPANEPSAAEWVRVYPRHLILPAGEQQTIRFAVRPPQDLPDGEYWVRPAIMARPMEATTKQAAEGITTQLNIVRRTLLSLNYRHGQVKTGATIQALGIQMTGSTLYLSPELQRQGNAAYLGHIDIRVTDAAGRIQKQIRREIAVYHGLKPVYQLDTSDLPSGSYAVEVTLSASDRAKSDRGILNALPASITGDFVIE